MTTGAPLRGWYPDPAQPDRERWWTGVEWSSYTARWRFGDNLLPEYARSMRAGPNRAAARGILVTRLATIPLAVVLVLAFVVGATEAPLVTTLLIAVVVLTLGLSLWAFIEGVRGIRASDRLGAKALSVHTVVASAADVFVVITVPTIVIAILQRA